MNGNELIALLNEANTTQKLCQRGTNNYQDANTLHALCYGVIGRLCSALGATTDGNEWTLPGPNQGARDRVR